MLFRSAEATDYMVEERSESDTRGIGRYLLGLRSDHAGMSNDNAGENPARRKPKVSWGREIRPGLAGPLVKAEKRRRWKAG